VTCLTLALIFSNARTTPPIITPPGRHRVNLARLAFDAGGGCETSSTGSPSGHEVFVPRSDAPNQLWCWLKSGL